MSLRPEEIRETEFKSALREAYAFLVSLDHNEADPKTVAANHLWLEESQVNRDAWRHAKKTWESSRELSRDLRLELVKQLSHRSREAPRRRRNRGYRIPVLWATAACGLMLVAFGVLKLGLRNQTTFSTPIGEQRTVILDDGTRITLDTATRLIVQYDKHIRRITLESGEAFFDVAHESRPFSVRAGQRKVIALGTSFMVRRGGQSEENLTVTLIQGRVAVAKPDEPDTLSLKSTAEKMVLDPGQRLQMHGSAGSVVIDHPSMERETGWMRGQIYFDHTRLADAVTELNRYSRGVRLSVSSSVTDILVGGIFRAGDSESFAYGMAVYGLRVVRDGDTLTLQPAGEGH